MAQVPFDSLIGALKTFSLIYYCFPSTASKIRGSVAQVPFDEFHRYSATLIRKAVFGVDEKGKIRNRLKFDANNLVSISTCQEVDMVCLSPVGYGV